MVTFLVPEVIPSLNKGEAAILKGIVKTLESVGENEIYVYSMHPEIDGPRYESDDVRIISGDTLATCALYCSNRVVLVCRHIRAAMKHTVFLLLHGLLGPNALRIMRGPLWRAYDRADVIIVGHDGSFSYFYLTLILFCRALRKPVVIYGASMLPWILGNSTVRRLVRFCLERVDLITLREDLSRQLLEEIGADNPYTYVTADKAFLLDPAPAEVIDEVMLKEGIGRDENGILVGVTVAYGSRVFKESFADVSDVQEKRYKHSAAIAGVIDYLIERFDAQVLLIPHSIGLGSKYDDRIAARDVFGEVANKEEVVLINNEYTPEELKGLIGRCDLLVGERTHSVIAATSMSVPSLMITYSKDYRTHGIIGQMLGQERWIYGCEKMQVDTLIDHVNQLWVNREMVRSDLMSRAPEMKKRATMNGELMRELLERKGILQDNAVVLAKT